MESFVRIDSKSTNKSDYFGRPVKNKFPYYPYGVIIPGCQAGTCRHLKQPYPKVSTPTPKAPCNHNPAQQSRDKSKNGPQQTTTVMKTNLHCKKNNVPTCSNKKRVSSVDACRKVALIVAKELPECCNEEFLREIEIKCRNYWDTLRRHSIYLDEDEVCKELTLKLQAWVAQSNDDLQSSSSSYETGDNEDESRRQDELEEFEDDDDEYSEQQRFPVRGTLERQ